MRKYLSELKAKYLCDRNQNERASCGHQQLTCKCVFSFEKINPEIVQSTLASHFQFPKGNKTKQEKKNRYRTLMEDEKNAKQSEIERS